ncbi:protein zyg-11 homolog B-like [Onthophagus taurus]|uniref:protein zyg-11 homolog B-like n=1 Tax=Onthophagus taurus TaxID=166361 RepID=UPI0039BE5965
MCDNPPTLLNACLEYICDNMGLVFQPNYVYNTEYSYTFRDQNISLCTELCEQLLEHLVEKDCIRDLSVSIFTKTNTRLRRVKLKDCQYLTSDGFEVLLRHNVHEFECVNVNTTPIDIVLANLNEWSIRNLKSLNISKYKLNKKDSRTLNSSIWDRAINQITSLENLRSLNVAYTEFNQTLLEVICDKLGFLEKLNISGTLIVDLKPLVGLTERLIMLGISDLDLCPPNANHIINLTRLKHLDLSLINKKSEHVGDNIVKRILSNPEVLPDLYLLDISGWKNPSEKDVLIKFIQSHRKLECLGLVTNPIANDPYFNSNNDTIKRKFLIAGLGSDEQISRTLILYEDKAYFVQKALYHLFQLTSGFEGPRPDMIQQVLAAMKRHSTKFGVQVAGTACLYNLTRADLAKKIHPSLLARGVLLILDAMTQFHDEYQLQKNSLLNLCSDRILQEVNIDRFRCAHLVLDALCSFDEADIKRMAVAICSILAAKISTEQTSQLGAKPLYMSNLLAMVENRVELKQSDITLKFTLSALWNLTDESAATCCVFLEHGGANLFLKVLKTFKNDSTIETRVLGLLNNIAEVEYLRKNLFIEELINELYFLLRSEYIDVSYFAAGIIAHLASEGEENWGVKMYKRKEMLSQLEEAINEWSLPECEMVAYRRFKPFFPLLEDRVDYQVQLWAVWAIYHVCNKNPTRYCKMLSEENGILLLKHLAYSDNSHVTIKKITRQVLGIVEENQR